IDGDVRAAERLAEEVNRLGELLFADPALAGDEHRLAVARDLGQAGLELDGRRTEPDPVEALLGTPPLHRHVADLERELGQTRRRSIERIDRGHAAAGAPGEIVRTGAGRPHKGGSVTARTFNSGTKWSIDTHGTPKPGTSIRVAWPGARSGTK